MADEYPPLNRRIGDRLRAARHAQGLSLTQLSERTDGSYSKSRISNYEQGIRRLGIEGAQTLAQALGSVSAAYLLCVDEDEVLAEDEKRLIECFRNSDQRGKQTILDISKAQ